MLSLRWFEGPVWQHKNGFPFGIGFSYIRKGKDGLIIGLKEARRICLEE